MLSAVFFFLICKAHIGIITNFPPTSYTFVLMVLQMRTEWTIFLQCFYAFFFFTFVLILYSRTYIFKSTSYTNLIVIIHWSLFSFSTLTLIHQINVNLKRSWPEPVSALSKKNSYNTAYQSQRFPFKNLTNTRVSMYLTSFSQYSFLFFFITTAPFSKSLSYWSNSNTNQTRIQVIWKTVYKMTSPFCGQWNFLLDCDSPGFREIVTLQREHSSEVEQVRNICMWVRDKAEQAEEWILYNLPARQRCKLYVRMC